MNVGPVCVVGSINADRYAGLARLPQPGETVLGAGLGMYPGGKGLNQAISAARCGAEVRMCGAVGSDPDAAMLREAMRASGIDCDYVVEVDGVTGVAYVFSLPGGENSIVVAQGANAQLRLKDAVASVRGARVLLTQLEIQTEVAAESLRAARSYGVTTVLNAAPAHPATWEMLPFVDILIVNESEAAALGGLDALRLHTTVVQTRGAEGVSVFGHGDEPFHVPAFPIEPVDTTGAGDAFCGGFAAALARGDGLRAATLDGAAAGAIVAQHRGAQPTALSASAVRDLVAVVPSHSPANW
ncbi:Ribokinase [Microbacterium esteraromaticum]|uniref:Ribokinase n=1 Tax=Microbacterium esteraromaticum TaxID=57043 RepID=A0A1R4IQ68_9MICO|nr:ribokinase [Microbacterium esteraromaticum]SJN21383.1 Ribokinase [Microbacterium esteraromaticum]